MPETESAEVRFYAYKGDVMTGRVLKQREGGRMWDKAWDERV
jgi:hypothetical protein